MSADSIQELQGKIARFVRERDWEQFHSPRNLASAIAVEAGELLAHFRWLDDDASRSIAKEPRSRDEIAAEIADVCILAFEMARSLDINLAEAMDAKLRLNEERYPVEKSRGSAAKYTEFE